MKRVLLDTSVYGIIAGQKEFSLISDAIKRTNMVVYGTVAIRKELRDTPRLLSIIEENRKKNLRVYLLTIYDAIVNDHVIPQPIDLIKHAQDYYTALKELNATSHSFEALKTDLMIIATASRAKLDIVVSEDNEAFLSLEAQKAYSIVNAIKKLRTPLFYKYTKFKQFLALRSSE